MLTTEDFFKEGGLLSQVKKNFTTRDGQQELSDLIIEGVDTETNIISECPTGFGKSFSVLVPAIVKAVNDGLRIVVSTATLALSDQYVDYDLPTLLKAANKAGHNFTFAVAKGKNNFICRSKLSDDGLDSPSRYSGLPKLKMWAESQIVSRDTGDVSSIPFNFANDDWREIGAEESCHRKACQYYGSGSTANGHTDCFVYQAKKEYRSAQIVVANHALVLLDAMLGAGTILGEYDLLIFDEAHEVPERAQDAWAVNLLRTRSQTH